ncbi:DUF2237 domain-containing protein [Algoriphagus aestuariicola]|uniref:DUF2237 domain-containing protein n=1 Tax=Algoriphagus aestuariicola TaxID=1852016 RepID=A0ABS3BNC1_9BACT|nr:DUF2237 domain-containing protein [Algoriphagus aestuariicola]MBN7800401.1 DUF2237 domain-containing protein [Algoriphagus aestuariicola]
MAKNVFGEELTPCSMVPLTGFYRNGCCETGEQDVGVHTVCAVMSDVFLSFSASRGNDLSTPRPEFGFPGLQPGDKWCLCASRWMEAYRAGFAPLVFLEATEEGSLNIIPMELLVSHALK